MGVGSSEDFRVNVQGKTPSTGDPNGQYKSAYGTYVGDYGTPRNPDFLVNNPKELEAMIRQRNQSLYGGLSTDIRESLGSSGLLASGAFPEALAGAQIRIGQDTAGQINDLYMQELQRKRQFDTQRALALLGGDTQKAVTDQATNQDFLQSIMGAGATIGSALIPGAGGGIDPLALIKHLINGGGTQFGNDFNPNAALDTRNT